MRLAISTVSILEHDGTSCAVWGQLKKVFLCIVSTLLLKGVDAAPTFGKPGKCISSIKKWPEEAYHLKAVGVFGAPLAKAIGAAGTKDVAMVLVSFTDKAMLAGDITTFNAYATAFKNYYTEASYGLITLNITFITRNVGNTATVASADLTGEKFAINLPQNEAFYGNDDNAVPSPLVKDAVVAANALAGVDVIKGTGAGEFDAVMVVHSGLGEEVNGVATDVFSAYTEGGDHGGGFTEGMRVPIKERNAVTPVGVICHEFGHQLGLPDLYSAGEGGDGTTRVGAWSVMDQGVYLPNPAADGNAIGNVPAHFDVWSRLQLGWTSPTVQNVSPFAISLRPAETNANDAIRIPIQTSLDSNKEFFLIEYRLRGNGAAGRVFDRYIPNDGLLIWHIDDTVGEVSQNNINQNKSHKRVDVEEADSTDPSTSADAGDPFPGTTGNRAFKAPQSNAYNGKSSGVTVLNISAAGGATMTADLFVSDFGNLQVVSPRNFPNPFKPSESPNTTIVFTLTEPADDAEVHLYSLSGNLIRTLGNNDLTVTRVADNTVVYKAAWDGKDSDGKEAASGVYLFRVRAKVTRSANQTLTKSGVGKLAIIR